MGLAEEREKLFSDAPSAAALRTMESSVWTRAAACALLLLTIACAAQTQDSDQEVDLDTRALRDFYPKDPNLTNEKELLGALQEVLEKLQSKRIPLWEKKFGRVPTCDVGEQCAIRKGARIGKMCDCPRGAVCNFFLLKCL
ncbi:cocaine- and amphetamine-regulated transcript protein-like [Hoplias malabaricus]|uniref:cocaine- and amphetamine-regulated transcript protein-like n=1 Tax=Hoplias malabaricus TaxID=27720 RepID=UPI0034632C85